MDKRVNFIEREKRNRHIDWGGEVEERILTGHWDSKVVGSKENKINY
jgi:hypothetical protein